MQTHTEFTVKVFCTHRVFIYFGSIWLFLSFIPLPTFLPWYPQHCSFILSLGFIILFLKAKAESDHPQWAWLFGRDWESEGKWEKIRLEKEIEENEEEGPLLSSNRMDLIRSEGWQAQETHTLSECLCRLFFFFFPVSVFVHQPWTWFTAGRAHGMFLSL